MKKKKISLFLDGLFLPVKKKKKMTFSLLQSLMIKLVSYRNQIFGMIRATLDYKKPAASLHRWENKEERNEVAPVWGKYD